MRLKLAVIVMLALPVVAVAQPSQAPPSTPSAGGVVPLPPIGLPLPQIGLPLPPIGLPAAGTSEGRRAANRAGPRTRTPHRSAFPVVPVYGWPYYYEAPAATPSSPSSDSVAIRAAGPPVGYLQFDIPGDREQQLYVDGFYLGTLLDFASGVALEAGPHAVEIRAPGFETLSVAVNIASGRTIAYRGALKATEVKPAAAATAASSGPLVPAAPMVGYIVPGCYIGNVPPQDAGLPATCDLSRTITIKR
jgi:hypothetical protein